MNLDNFKEILRKKAEGLPEMQTLIKYMKDEYLAEHITESLEKMAATKNVNQSSKHFAHRLSNRMVKFLYDQLSHHASHYKAAIKNSETNQPQRDPNNPKSKPQKPSDKHMMQIFNVMKLLDAVTEHGSGNTNETAESKKLDQALKLSFVNTRPWERNSRHPEHHVKGWSDKRKSFDHLLGEPATSEESYLKAAEGGHNKSYPLEEIALNGKHIHIDDDIEGGGEGEYIEHLMDSHPIFKYFNDKKGDQAGGRFAEFLKEYSEWHSTNPDSPMSQMKTQHKAAKEADPEGHAARGSVKSDPVHAHINEGLEGASLDMEELSAAKNKPKIKIGSNLTDEEVKAKFESLMGTEGTPSKPAQAELSDDEVSTKFKKLMSPKVGTVDLDQDQKDSILADFKLNQGKTPTE